MNRDMKLLEDITVQIRGLFHQLVDVADSIHVDITVSASQRAVLECLFKREAETVPNMARVKAVSRQHIQTIVNELVSKGLVETKSNPAHQRSPLLVLTAQGESSIRQIQQKEEVVLEKLARHFQQSELEITLGTLATLRKVLNLEDLV